MADPFNQIYNTKYLSDLGKQYLSYFKETYHKTIVKDGKKKKGDIVPYAWKRFTMPNFKLLGDTEYLLNGKKHELDQQMCIAKELLQYKPEKLLLPKDRRGTKKFYSIQRIAERLYEFKNDHDGGEITFQAVYDTILTKTPEEQEQHGQYMIDHAQRTRDLLVLAHLGYEYDEKKEKINFDKVLPNTLASWLQKHKDNRVKKKKKKAIRKLRKKIKHRLQVLDDLKKKKNDGEEYDEDQLEMYELSIFGFGNKKGLKHNYKDAKTNYKDEVGSDYVNSESEPDFDGNGEEEEGEEESDSEVDYGQSQWYDNDEDKDLAREYKASKEKEKALKEKLKKKASTPKSGKKGEKRKSTSGKKGRGRNKKRTKTTQESPSTNLFLDVGGSQAGFANGIGSESD